MAGHKRITTSVVSVAGIDIRAAVRAFIQPRATVNAAIISDAAVDTTVYAAARSSVRRPPHQARTRVHVDRAAIKPVAWPSVGDTATARIHAGIMSRVCIARTNAPVRRGTRFGMIAR
jgi:hypothetical protein